MNEPSPFHEGEQRVQAMLGVRETIEPWARQVVRSYLPAEHRDFHTALPFLVAAARDPDGRPWATLLTGPPDFVRSPNSWHLSIGARPLPGDALEGAFVAGAEVGILGIELSTRRRNRVNGTLVETGNDGVLFQVGQSFGNCPQHIHAREWRRVALPESPAPATRCARLTPSMVRWIRAADTLFIASGHRGEAGNAAYGMDASHRGGEPGFVRVEGDDRLVIPDFAGNNHYNTIGNLVVEPGAGLLFVDFERGSMLQLTGRTTIDWDSDEVARHPGARRLIRFHLDEAVELPEALPLRWSASAGATRALRVVGKHRESEDVTSFMLAARDGAPLPPFEAGQHLPVALHLPGEATPVRRTYSLSGAPGEAHYRISVKREPRGLASRHLHDVVEEGANIDAQAPAGTFVLGHDAHPVVLLSAGVGVTPMVSMLHALSRAAQRRPAWFVHGARDGHHHPLATEVRALVEGNPDLHLHVAYSRPLPADEQGRDYHSTGRVDVELVAHLLPSLDAEFYLCGPAGFMADIHAQLSRQGVPPDRIHSESFGPSA